MKYRKISYLLAGVMAVALGATALTVTAAESAKAETQTKAITKADLEKFLKDMGYEPKQSGDTGFNIVLKRDSWTVYFTCALSADGSKLYLMSTLENIEDITKVPADVLANLLEGSYNTSAASFYLRKAGNDKNKNARVLKVAFLVDNRAITAAVLRDGIDQLFTTIKDTKSLWKASEWKVAKGDAAVGGDKKLVK